MHIGYIGSFFDQNTVNIYLSVELATNLKVREGREINTYNHQLTSY